MLKPTGMYILDKTICAKQSAGQMTGFRMALATYGLK